MVTFGCSSSTGSGATRAVPGTGDSAIASASPARLLVEELWSAARRDFAERVRLLVEHGADVNLPGLRDGRTPCEAAVLAGNAEVAAYLRGQGAQEVVLDPGDAFAAAVVSGRRAEALSLLKKHPGLPGALGLHGRMQLLQRAVEAGQLDGVRLMAELGFEISGITRHDGVGVSLAATPLHNAAWIGNLPMVRLLIELGADPNLRDPNHDATPPGVGRIQRSDRSRQVPRGDCRNRIARHSRLKVFMVNVEKHTILPLAERPAYPGHRRSLDLGAMARSFGPHGGPDPGASGRSQ